MAAQIRSPRTKLKMEFARRSCEGAAALGNEEAPQSKASSPGMLRLRKSFRFFVPGVGSSRSPGSRLWLRGAEFQLGIETGPGLTTHKTLRIEQPRASIAP